MFSRSQKNLNYFIDRTISALINGIGGQCPPYVFGVVLSIELGDIKIGYRSPIVPGRSITGHSILFSHF
ncbi:MAG: hypothetical protein HC778_04770 [Chamaesiphon sp. CSU_1_12]|nr:hypothetical protein [Chamaesiphon sp. CSU_1_12]